MVVCGEKNLHSQRVLAPGAFMGKLLRSLYVKRCRSKEDMRSGATRVDRVVSQFSYR
jgi:hypothetical protein